MSFTLRDYQSIGVQETRAEFARGARRVLYVLPTGGGKTAVFSYIAESVETRGKRALILVHRQELLLQASRSLNKVGVKHGLISPLFNETSDSIQIASVQTLVRRLKRFPPPDLIIIDEAHHAVSKTYRDILEAFPEAHVLGVTATPCRTDGQGLGVKSEGIFEEMVLGPSMADLIRRGFLTPARVFGPPVGIDLEGVPRRYGDFDKKELGNRIDKPTITGSAVEHYLRLCRGMPAIAFCVSIEHAKRVAAQFRAEGVRALPVDGGMPDEERRRAIEGLGDGSVDLLTSADLIGEGVDVPACTVAIQLRPTESLALHLQQIGRALRPIYADGVSLETDDERRAAIASGPKPFAYVLDHVGNTMKHGFPDSHRNWELDPESYGSRSGTGSGLRGGVRVEQCDDCFFIYEIGPDRCPSCGSERAVKARKIREREGELAELRREEIEAARKRNRQEQGAAKSLSDLIALGKQRGVKNPRFWAEQILRGRLRK